jgi:hypothetical protein
VLAELDARAFHGRAVLPDRAALATVKPGANGCATGSVTLDLLGTGAKSEKSVELGERAGLDLDLVAGPDAFVVAWSDHDQLEPRVVTAIAGGRVINPKTARSQVMGGIVWGIGSALHEEGVLDHRFGRFMAHNLADYHVPVNADVTDVEVIFVEERDELVNPLGAKGLGEIGVVGVAAAIANAVFHATGRRIRELPITLDKLL